ncbi:MAG: type III-B CRISPR module RAMP protein Cmr4 [Planctomycetes bacterium]|nr:type III-B CRISPR module RAMP protein Cmr4 [Planctomycetota bacterium]
MFERGLALFLYAESPVHWGTGSSLSSVDLPVQRERHTDYPIAQAAGLKGSLRDFYERHGSTGAHALVESLFGSLKDGETAGCVAVSDARLLLFPVRSLKGTFAYVTSRFALARLERDLDRLEIPPDWKVPDEPAEGKALVVTGSKNVLEGQKLILEEFFFEARESQELDKIAGWIAEHAFPAPEDSFWQAHLAKGMVLLPGDAFRDFVRHATTVETHIRIDDDTGTAAEHMLFTQEVVPADSLFWSLVLCAKPFQSKNGSPLKSATQVMTELSSRLDNDRMQTGGDATTGRGQVALRTQAGAQEN